MSETSTASPSCGEDSDFKIGNEGGLHGAAFVLIVFVIIITALLIIFCGFLTIRRLCVNELYQQPNWSTTEQEGHSNFVFVNNKSQTIFSSGIDIDSVEIDNNFVDIRNDIESIPSQEAEIVNASTAPPHVIPSTATAPFIEATSDESNSNSSSLIRMFRRNFFADSNSIMDQQQNILQNSNNLLPNNVAVVVPVANVYSSNSEYPTQSRDALQLLQQTSYSLGDRPFIPLRPSIFGFTYS